MEHRFRISNQFNLLKFNVGANVSFLKLFPAFVHTWIRFRFGSSSLMSFANVNLVWCGWLWLFNYIYWTLSPAFARKMCLFKWIKGCCHSIDITDIAIMSIEPKTNVVFYARVKWLSCYVAECDLVFWISQPHTTPTHTHARTIPLNGLSNCFVNIDTGFCATQQLIQIVGGE